MRHSWYIAACLVLAAAPLRAAEEKPYVSPVGDSPYYESVLKICEGRAGRACCRASVIAMYNETASPAEFAQGCPQGFKMVSLPCPASLNWCRIKGYKPPQE